MAKVRFTEFMPATVELEGAEATIEVKRLTIDEFIPFEQKYLEYSRPMPGLAEASEEAQKQRASDVLAWMKDQITNLVRVPEGEMEGRDGQPVTTGERFYEELGAQFDAKIGVVNQIYAHNRFGEEVRKKLRSPSGLATTSDEPPTGAAGPKQERIVASAEPLASASTEGAHPQVDPTADLAGATTAA